MYLCRKDTTYLVKMLRILNISARIKEIDGEKYIWDSLRRRWLVLTPEEEVRQHTIEWLVRTKGVPPLRIAQEYPVNVNGQSQRADIVVIDDFAKPYILVECKAPDVKITDEVLRQALRYNSFVGARYVMLTNGEKLFCYECSDGQYRAVTNF